MKLYTQLTRVAVVSFFAFGMLLAVPQVSAQTLKGRDAAARAEYQQSKAQYQKEVGFYKQSRKNYIDARNKYNTLKNAENKSALEAAARNYLETAVNTLIARLNSIRTWVGNRPTLDETEKQALIAEIDADIAWLNERKSSIQTAAPDKLKEEAQKVRDYWRTHRINVKGIVGRIKAARISYILGKLEEFGDEVEQKIAELKTQGKDTTQLEAWFADYEQKLAIANQKYETAKARYKAIKGEPGPDFDRELREADQLAREGNQFVKEANQYIIDAHKQLVQIVQEMKTTPPSIDPSPPPQEGPPPQTE